MSSEESVILAIRVRGLVKVRPQIDDTLKKLLLGRLHQARLFKMTPSIKGMINKSKDYITWGEPTPELLNHLIIKRGRLPGNDRVTDAYVKKNSSYSSIKALAKALATGSASVEDVEGLKPVFRLTPPSGGFKGKKYLAVGMGGITGYRGAAINDLVTKMI